MDVFVLFFNKRWAELTTATGALAVTGWLWKHRDSIKEFWLFIFGLKKRIETIEKNQTLSKEAQFCPNCDKRMTILDASRFDIWFYRCELCSLTLKYAAPTAPKMLSIR